MMYLLILCLFVEIFFFRMFFRYICVFLRIFLWIIFSESFWLVNKLLKFFVILNEVCFV